MAGLGNARRLSMSVPTVLIVDDEESTRVLLGTVLKKDKYNILTAKHGREALELFHKNQPNVVILDLYMPIMDGFEFLWEIQPKPDDPFEIIAVTVHASDEEITRCYDMGVNRVIRKPFVFPEIRRIIQQSIENKRKEIEHRNVEEKLKKNESFYKKILGIQSDLILCFQKDSGTIYFNDLCADLLPEEAHEALKGLNFIDIIHAADRKLVLEKLDEINIKKPHVHFESRSGTEDDQIWYSWTCAGTFDNDGQLTEITAFGKDISSDKNVIAELQNFKNAYEELQDQKAAHLKNEKAKLQRTNETLCGSEMRYRKLFDNTDEGIIITELETGKIVDCNQALLDFLGYERTELLAKPLSVLFPEKLTQESLYDGLSVNSGMDEVILSEKNILDRTGTKKAVRLKTALIETNNKKFIQQLIDSKEHSAARYYFKKHIKYMDSFIELFPYAIYIKDKNNRFVAMNSACERILALEKDKVIGTDASSQISAYEYNFFLADDSDVLHKMEGIETEEEFVPSSSIGDKTVYRKKKIILTGWENNLTVLLGVIEDLSSKKKTDTEIKKAKNIIDELEFLKAQFVANINHEVRTPLNSILGAADMLRETALKESQKKFTDIIKASGVILLNVINNILDYAFLKHGTPCLHKARFTLAECVDDLVKSITMETEKKSLSVNTVIAPEIPAYLYGDSPKLKQILLHLLCNAVKFTEKGEIKLKVSMIQDDDFRNEKTVKLLFVVKDTGIGIPADKKEEIFRPFNQVYNAINRKYDGSGLGLAICAMLVKLANGKIWAESNEGSGSSFYFTIDFESVE